MQLKTILNRVQKFKPFLYGSARWVNEAGQPAVGVALHVRANSRATGRDTTGWRRGALSLFISGGLRCSFFTRHGEWAVPAVG